MRYGERCCRSCLGLLLGAGAAGPQGSRVPLGGHPLPGGAIGKAPPGSVGNGGDDEERRRSDDET
jgi:hypothetical protein